MVKLSCLFIKFVPHREFSITVYRQTLNIAKRVRLFGISFKYSRNVYYLWLKNSVHLAINTQGAPGSLCRLQDNLKRFIGGNVK